MLRVLLVEDSPADVLLIREAIALWDGDVRLFVAHDGESAENLIATLALDIIILDLGIPKRNGHKVLGDRVIALKNLQRFPQRQPPIVVFTGSENPMDRYKALTLGAAEFVVKPHSYAGFIQTVHDILERWTPEGSSGDVPADRPN